MGRTGIQHCRRIDDIILQKEDLLQSIRVEGDLWGESIDNAEEDATRKAGKQELDHPMINGGSQRGNSLRDIVDDEVKREKVIRVIDLAVNEVADMLYPYTKVVECHPAHVVSNIYNEPEMWQISLNVPTTMSPTTTNYLKVLSIEYIVARVIQDWCEIYLHDRLAFAVSKVESVCDKITKAKDRRIVAVRRKSSVY